VEIAASRKLLEQYIHRYHYLGYRVPYGAQLRYLVRAGKAPHPVLACLLFTSAARRMAPRDHWIGWSDQTRRRHLAKVVNNSRFFDSAVGEDSEPGQSYFVPDSRCPGT
jgi:hypothetical protein